jgi:formylglycine-generating enzyme required for sulfatase activity
MSFTAFTADDFSLIPVGTFTMGSPTDEKDRSSDETQHQVTLTKPFFMGRAEVTRGQWKKVMRTEPWKGRDYVQDGDDYPAVYVTWDDAVTFCRRLSRISRRTYRLPTEAEWEYACRGGTQTAFSFGDDEKQLAQYAWVKASGDLPLIHQPEVSLKLPNAFGLYDMHGSVWEWCSDWYGNYTSTQLTDPRGPSAGSFRVLRGGSWKIWPSAARCAYRHCCSPNDCNDTFGFRLVLEVQ